MGISNDLNLKVLKKLYYRDSLSAVDISKKFNIGLASVYYRMKKHGLMRRNFYESNLIKFKNKPLSFKLKNVLNNRELELKSIGTMLYWAEGFQSEKAKIVDFANSKPKMILIFLRFLREICGVDSRALKAYLYCYSNQNVNDLINFWSKITKIPRAQFTKPYIRKDFDSLKTGKMPYGLLHIRYGDKRLLSLIKNWIEYYTLKFN